jgi:tRNA A37 threonylcarbamoyladenosine dehydratase
MNLIVLKIFVFASFKDTLFTYFFAAGAGVGRIGIVDYDTISIDNLHRQTLHSENDIGQRKTQSIADAIKRFGNVYFTLRVNNYFHFAD